jgi:putative nucleotidyltransferase with HDIG domain
VIATCLVVVLPALAVWTIIPAGDGALLALSIPLGMALSLLAASLGGAIWKRTPGSRDLVFADLMLWGWLRRVRTERRLARAETLLGDHAKEVSVEALTELSALLEARDSFTYGHSQRVTRHAEQIATAMGLSTAGIAQVRTAAALHDVGKLHTPRAIINKPGPLTDEEFAVIRRHPSEGADMAASLGDPTITAIIRHHHERLDGGGYPDGLAGEAIPLGARIIAVADTFDAMTSNRAYRRASSHKRALDVLAREAGTQLDPAAVTAFLGYYRGRRAVAWSAFATAAPQRFFAWLGGASPALGAAGAAGAAAFAIGIGEPRAPVVSPADAAPRHAAKHEEAPVRAHPTVTPPAALGHPPGAGGPPAPGSRSPGSPAKRTPQRRAKARAHKPKHHPKRAKSHGKRAAAAPQAAAPRVKPPKVKKVKPVKVKPQQAARRPTAPQPVVPPKVKPPKVKPPKVTAPPVVAQPAPPKPEKPPKVKP